MEYAVRPEHAEKRTTRVDVLGVLDRRRAQRERGVGQDPAQRYLDITDFTLDIADFIVLVLDVEGRIALINRKGCEILGRSAAELRGCDWFVTCLPQRIRGELHCKFDALVRGDLSVVENPVVTKSGEEHVIAWHNQVLRDNHGRIVGTFSIGSDITGRPQGDDRSHGNLDVFRATMRTVHHIVNNRLNALRLLLMEHRSELPEDVFGELDRLIDATAKRLKTLSNIETIKLTAGAIGALIDYPEDQ